MVWSGIFGQLACCRLRDLLHVKVSRRLQCPPLFKLAALCMGLHRSGLQPGRWHGVELGAIRHPAPAQPAGAGVCSTDCQLASTQPNHLGSLATSPAACRSSSAKLSPLEGITKRRTCGTCCPNVRHTYAYLGAAGSSLGGAEVGCCHVCCAAFGSCRLRLASTVRRCTSLGSVCTAGAVAMSVSFPLKAAARSGAGPSIEVLGCRTGQGMGCRS